MTSLNTLNNLKTKKIRVGRGIGSGKGKTSGRGVKGQKSRSGVSIKSFEGGQMPLYRRLPKRGFKTFGKKEIGYLNLSKIQSIIDSKKIKSSEKIDLVLLKKLNIIKKKYKKFKVLSNGDFNSKIDIEVDYLSKTAKEKIEKAGGQITVKNQSK